MTRPTVLALLASAVLASGACAPEAPIPDAAIAPGRVLLGTFSGEIDPEAGTITIRPDASAASGRTAIAEITGVSLSNASTPVKGTSCPGPAASLAADVRITATPFSSTTLYTDVYAQIETLAPVTGATGCNSAAHPGGFANTGYGLWYYPSLGNAAGISTTWMFGSPTGTKTTFSGKVYGTAAVVAATKIAFITSTNDYNGNHGGLAGADSRCQALADTAITAGKIPSGTYKAFLSTRSTSPAVDARDRIPDAAYVRTDGAVIATSKSELLSTGPRVRISVTESGAAWAKSASLLYAYVWTGSRPTGVLDQTNSTSTCTDWSSSNGADRGTVGCVYAYPTQCGNSPATWTDQGGGNQANCGATPAALYCFQQ